MMEEVETSKNGQVSPLLNYLVMEKIISYMGFKDWKSCRSVCSFWNEAILKSKLNKVVLIYLEDTSLRSYLNILEQNSLQSLVNPGYENYNLKINSLLSQNNKMNILWDEVGYKIKHLRLEITTLYALRKLRDVLLRKTDSMEEIKIFVNEFWGQRRPSFENKEYFASMEPQSFIHPNYNLTSFSYSYLGSLSLYGMGNPEEFSFPIKWEDFFKRFPKIKKLILVGLSELELTQMLTALHEEFINDSNQPALPLKQLELLDENMFPEAPNNGHLQILINLNLSLQELHLEISPLLNTSLLNAFLTKISPTLESLRLRRFPLMFLPEQRITLNLRLENVTFLEMSNELVPSLEFLSFLPKLETLHIILRDYKSLGSCEIIANTPESLESHLNLRNVYIEPPLLSEDCIISLGRLIPNLTRLKIRLNDEMLWALCGSQTIIKVLEELNIISWGGLTDEGFTGVPDNVWGPLLMGMSSDVHQFRVFPFIGDLINLRKLTVEMWSDYYNHISDHSVHFGFLELEKLKEFHAIRIQISDNAQKLMKKRFEICEIEEP